MGTPHIRAEKEEIAKSVLMPGDPLRAKFVAETFLENVRLINDVRNVLGYTGTYEGKELTVMGSGMGMPSIGIYSYELFSMYDVERIIRIGSAGAYVQDLELYDIVLADDAWSRSSYAKVQSGATESVMHPSKGLNRKIMKASEELRIPVIEARVHSSDVFYAESNVESFKEISEKYGCACVEMESFALFHNAKVLGKEASCLLTISDSLVTGESTDSTERERAFTNMMKVALHAVTQE